MAPKPLHQLGSTKPHGNGWRAVVHLKHGEEYCPLRTTRCAAEADLARIRGATSREEIPQITRAIRGTAWGLAAARPTEVTASSEQSRAAASATSACIASSCDTASTLEGLTPSPSADAADGAREAKVYPWAELRKCMGTSGN